MSNMSTFVNGLADRTVNNLVTSLKNEIDVFKDFLTHHYVDPDEDFNQKIYQIIDNGYEHCFKIDAYIQIIFEKDENQSVKNRMEDCLKNFITPPRFKQLFNSLIEEDCDSNIKWINYVTRVAKHTPDLIPSVQDIVTIEKEHTRLNKYKNLNGYINEILVLLTKLKIILRNL